MHAQKTSDAGSGRPEQDRSMSGAYLSYVLDAKTRVCSLKMAHRIISARAPR